MAVTDSARDSAYGFDVYEMAFSHVCNLASDHFKHLKELTDRVFETSKKAQILNIQAGRKAKLS